MPEKIRMIAVGMGGVSRGMLKALREKPWHELVAAVDVSDAALQRARDDNGLPATARYTDLQAALEQVSADVVMINTPSELHYAGAKAVVEAGLTPLVAKPLSNEFAAAVALTALAAEKGVKLSVAQQMRYSRHYLSVAEFGATGAISVRSSRFISSAPSPGISRAIWNTLSSRCSGICLAITWIRSFRFFRI